MLPDPPACWQADAPRSRYAAAGRSAGPAASVAERTYRNRTLRVNVQIWDRPPLPDGTAPPPSGAPERALSGRTGRQGKNAERDSYPARLVYDPKTRTGRLTVSVSDRLHVVIDGEDLEMPVFERWMHLLDADSLRGQAARGRAR